MNILRASQTSVDIETFYNGPSFTMTEADLKTALARIEDARTQTTRIASEQRALRDAVRAGRKIDAIKAVRTLAILTTDSAGVGGTLSLIAAKNIVEGILP